MADYNSDRTGSNIDLTLDKVDALDAKVQPTATGANVTGTVTADGLTVDGDATIGGLLSAGQTANLDVGYITGASYPAARISGYRNSGSFASTMSLSTMNTTGSILKRVGIDFNGDVSFYEDTGTTAKMVWDASAESLGIGGSPDTSRDVTIQNNSFASLKIQGGGSGDTFIQLTTDNNEAYVGLDESLNVLKLNNTNTLGGENHLVIDTSGNVGIGTASPSAKLDIVGDINVSGGVYLGGTGAANRLDDYEEGTFTPYFSSDAGGEWGGKTTNSGTYVKIGNVVHFTGEVTYTSKASGAGSTLRIRNLPFTASPTNIGVPEVGFTNVIPDSGNYKIRISATDLLFYSSGVIQGTSLIAEMPSSGTYHFNFSIVV